MTIKKDGIKWPTPSNIISDVTDKSNALVQWAANMTCEWIRQNCEFVEYLPDTYLETPHYQVEEDHLNKARFEYKNVSKRALDVGSQVHDAVRIWLLSGKEPSNPDDQVEKAFNAFLDFWKQNKMKTIRCEERFFMEDWSGMYDWYGWFQDLKYLLDWKTSSGFYREMRIQTAAYRMAIEQQGEIVNGNGVVRLDKETGECQFKDYSRTYEQDMKEFLLSKELYFARHPRIAGQFKKPF